jgi:hypothetical protein
MRTPKRNPSLRPAWPRRRRFGAAGLLALALTVPWAAAVLADPPATQPASGPASHPAAIRPSQPAEKPLTQPASRLAAQPASKSAAATLDQTRLAMDKWIETQQLISKESKEWQQAREVLQGRIDMVKKEIATLTDRIAEDQRRGKEASARRDELASDADRLKRTATRLKSAVEEMEDDVRRLMPMLPPPVQDQVKMLYARMPGAAASQPASAPSSQPAGEPVAAAPVVSIAERYQNVLGIMDAANKANNEIKQNLEVRTLPSGRSAEVTAIYVGLAAGYYIGGANEAGVGQPTASGWQWKPYDKIARELQDVVEMLQGKQTAAFVPLPVKIK